MNYFLFLKIKAGLFLLPEHDETRCKSAALNSEDLAPRYPKNIEVSSVGGGPQSRRTCSAFSGGQKRLLTRLLNIKYMFLLSL